MDNKKVWFVTGASKGLGLTLVKQLLSLGQQVAATSRSEKSLTKAVQMQNQDFLPLAVNLGSEESVVEAVAQTISHFGKIDVVVNNAGYGLAGSLEELSDYEARENFNINVFGSLNVIRNVMPHFRAQRSGHIFNVSSIGGFVGSFPGFGIYCATKFAVQGFSESLAAEAKAFGIKVTIVSPGYFRTNFLASDSLNVPKKEIQEYKEVRAIQNAHQNDINGNQAGDPEKAIDVLIKIASEPQAPLHLFLGRDAYDLAYQKINTLQQELEKWKEHTFSTSFSS